MHVVLEFKKLFLSITFYYVINLSWCLGLYKWFLLSLSETTPERTPGDDKRSTNRCPGEYGEFESQFVWVSWFLENAWSSVFVTYNDVKKCFWSVCGSACFCLNLFSLSLSFMNVFVYMPRFICTVDQNEVTFFSYQGHVTYSHIHFLSFFQDSLW